MHQFHGGNQRDSVTNSVYSSDQTRLVQQSPQNPLAKSSAVSSTSNLGKSVTSYMIKNENDDAVIVTSSSIHSPVGMAKLPTLSNTGSKHKRGPLNI
jgi:hypothetical protein